MKRNPLALVGWLTGILLLILLAGCNLPTSTPAPMPICDTGNLQAVTLQSPGMWEVVDSLTPTLTWTYPDLNCTPQGYRIDLSTGPFFEDDLGGGTGNPSTSWVPGSPLQPATEYAWAVTPINGTTLGPIAGYHYFFTGPQCDDPNNLVAPVLLTPTGAHYNEARDSLIWEYPQSCLPDGYRIDVDTSPDFSDTTLSGGTGSPSTRWGVGHPLTPCQEYYWRVAAVMDTGSTTVLGPYSEVGTFIAVTDADDCATTGGPPPSQAIIQGTVWQDQCSLPDGPLPDPLPAGCVPDGNGSARADGVQQASEPGIEGVEVTLHANADCSGQAVAIANTNADGLYRFEYVDNGTYCVRIEATSVVNTDILVPGTWTYPLSSDAVVTQNTTVAPGDLVTLNFGWYYQQAATPAASPQFQFDKNAFCRRGPGMAYPDITAIPSGETLPVLGRSPDSNWFYVHWDKYDVSCWVASLTGSLLGDLGDIVMLTPMPLPPTPTPTPVPAGDTTPPSITDLHALELEAYYPTGASCGSTQLDVTARINDDSGIDENKTRLLYRYVGADGSASPWYYVPIHDRAMGGQVGFIIDVGTEADMSLYGSNGSVEYKVEAFDTAGNKSVSGKQSVPVVYCP